MSERKNPLWRPSGLPFPQSVLGEFITEVLTDCELHLIGAFYNQFSTLTSVDPTEKCNFMQPAALSLGQQNTVAAMPVNASRCLE